MPVIKVSKKAIFDKPETTLTINLSSEGSSQEFSEQKIKPRFGKQRQLKNQHTASYIQHINLADEKVTKPNKVSLDEQPIRNIAFKTKSNRSQNMDVECVEDTNKKHRAFAKTSYRSTYKCHDVDLTNTQESFYEKSYLDEEVGPPKKPMTLEEEDKVHKSNVAKITFRTAKETLFASNPAARRTLGASRKAQAKFVSPMIGAQ